MVHFLPSSETLSAAYSVDRDVRKLEFTDKHCRRLDEREPRRVEEDVVLFLLAVGQSPVALALDVLVQHDVKGQPEGHYEEGVPDEEEAKCGHDL